MDLMDKVVALAKRRGFVYPGSEIYGGLANTYDYGPMGAELLRNIKNAWWEFFVTRRPNIYGLDTSILMSPQVWEASGHVEGFADTLIDCRNCQYRTRADHLIEDYFAKKGEEVKAEGESIEDLTEKITTERIPCPNCGEFDWTPPRKFNNLFETHIGIIAGEKSLAYLRGEIAQGMFVNFKNVLNSLSPKLPFGLAQSGAAFRNEITLGKFIHRTLQFNLAEFEFFFDPEQDKWEELYAYWEGEMWKWATEVLGLSPANLRWREHTDDERSFYSSLTKDLEYNFPFGFKELYGFAYRTDYDLKNHMEKSGADLRYTDSQTGRKFIPHVIEPTFGMDRSLLAVMLDAYHEEDDGKVTLKLKPDLAPYRVSVFPLLANKPDLVKKARMVYDKLSAHYNTAWDSRGNIGKRYAAQDEIGTPYCITIDFETLDNDTLTVRNRDTKKQERVAIDNLLEYLKNKES